MQRSDGANGRFLKLAQESLHLCAVFAYDVYVVTSGLRHPVVGMLHRSELAESIG